MWFVLYCYTFTYYLASNVGYLQLLDILEILEIYWNLKTLLEIPKISLNLIVLLEIFV